MFRTKIIVIIGYVAMAALSIFGIVWIYQEWLNYTKTVEPRPKRQEELVMLSNTLAIMYHAEGTSGLLSLTTDSKLKMEYDSLMTTIFNQIGYLKIISKEPVLHGYLDSLDVLLLRKKENTEDLIQLAKSIQADTIREFSRTTILNRKDMDVLDPFLTRTIVQLSEDTSQILGEKKGFFRRISDAIKSSDPDSLRQINTHSTTTQQDLLLPILKDTIYDFIREANYATQRKNAIILSQLMWKQSELYNMNERTTAQINQIMVKLEINEYNENMRLAHEQAETIRRSSVIMSIIAFSAIIVALIFMSWIIHSLTVSQRLQRQIETAKKNVEELLVSREQLMLTITHDIKAPIGSILGYLELIMKENPSFQDSYYIENMQHSATHILDLIHNLLDFHSLEVNEKKPDQQVFSPAALLSDIYESFIPDALKKELKFEFSSQLDKNWSYVSDPYRIRQVVNNILSNAIKYTPAEGSVILSAKIVRKTRPELVISVKDTGPGIREEDQQQIFNAFKRLDYTGEGIEGFGLGLNIASKMTRLLSGDISVESTVGKGSLFTVTLPVYFISPVISQPVDEPEEEHPVQVLFIDDDPIQRDLLSKIAQRAGMIPHACASAQEALNTLQKQHFDVIFSDIRMPDMTGFELVKQIRALDFEGAEVVPVIGFSAEANVSETRYKNAGFSVFLVKPFTFDQLIRMIRQYTGQIPVSPPVIPEKNRNFESLIAFAGDDPQAGKSIIRSFITETEKNYYLLKQAFSENDWETIQHVAHKMLPLAKMISAHQLVVLLRHYADGMRSKDDRTQLLSLIWENIQAANQFIS